MTIPELARPVVDLPAHFYLALRVLAIMTMFGVLVFLTIRFGPDCQPSQSVSVANIVLLAGCEDAR